MSNINEDTVLERFQAYLQDANKIGNALEMIIDDAVSESLSEGQALYIVENLILPQIVVRFALHLNDLNEMYGYEHSPHEVLSAFCDFNELSEDFQNDIAQEIVEAAAAHSDGDVDDEDVVFKREDWTKLSSAERQAKEKSFLRKLAAAHLDMRDLKPFIKDLDVGANPYGIYNGAKKYKAFDRAAHHYGHDPAPESYKEETFEEGTIQFPNSSGQGNDDEAQWHPLHKVALKHGYRYSHTTPIHQANGEVLHHHTWARGEHKIGAYAHDTQWSSKVSSASGHVWSGIGTVALDKHLANKAKRYKLQNNEPLPNTKIQESLLDPQGDARVQMYKRYMEQHPPAMFGHAITETSEADELKQTWKLREKHVKIFGRDCTDGFDNLFLMRSGCPK